jgi:hypothetical protein
MEKGLYKFYKELPSWAKGVLAISAVAGVGLIGWKIYRAVNPSDEEKKNALLLKDIDSEIARLRKKGIKQSYADSQYKTFADSCWEGMKYCVGDNYGNVEDILKSMKNDLDVLLLQKAYGERQLYCFGIPAGSKKELFQAVKSELGNEWGGVTGYRVNSINSNWKDKGITYQI